MVGIKDVAALAGVSISTVSYVMTGKRPIGAKLVNGYYRPHVILDT